MDQEQNSRFLETSKFGIIDIIVRLMEEVESFVEKPGKAKKDYVIGELKAVLSDEGYSIYEPVIDVLIEFIVEMSKGTYELNINNIKKAVDAKCKGCCNIM